MKLERLEVEALERELREEAQVHWSNHKLRLSQIVFQQILHARLSDKQLLLGDLLKLQTELELFPIFPEKEDRKKIKSLRYRIQQELFIQLRQRLGILEGEIVSKLKSIAEMSKEAPTESINEKIKQEFFETKKQLNELELIETHLTKVNRTYPEEIAIIRLRAKIEETQMEYQVQRGSMEEIRQQTYIIASGVRSAQLPITHIPSVWPISLQSLQILTNAATPTSASATPFADDEVKLDWETWDAGGASASDSITNSPPRDEEKYRGGSQAIGSVSAPSHIGSSSSTTASSTRAVTSTSSSSSSLGLSSSATLSTPSSSSSTSASSTSAASPSFTPSFESKDEINKKKSKRKKTKTRKKPDSSI